MSTKNNSNLKTILGKNIKYYRYQNKLTQENLAEKCDLSPRYISDIENGNGNITIETLAQLSDILNIDAFELLKNKKIKNLPQRINMK